jgi:hypothetical protein
MPTPGMFRTGKLGRKPYTHTLRTMRAALATARIMDALGPAPAASPGYSNVVDKIVSGDWGMMGNDTVGDCTTADRGHRLMLWTALGSGKIVIPTAGQVLAFYSQATGYNPADVQPDGSNPTDQGADMVTIAKDAETMALCGHVEDAFGTIDPLNMTHLKWAICLFGCAPLGINLQQAQMDQFNAGHAWYYDPSSPIIGGHDVLAVEYRPNGCFDVITWGAKWTCAPSFMNPANGIISEIVPVVSHDFVTPSGVAPSRINLKQMIADLKLTN